MRNVRNGGSLLLFVLLMVSAPVAASADQIDFDGEVDLEYEGSVRGEFGGSIRFPTEGEDESTAAEDVADAIADPVESEVSERRWISVPQPGYSGNYEDGNSGFCRDVEYIDVTGMTDAEESELIEQRNRSFQRSAEEAAMYREHGVADAELLCPYEEMEGLDPVFIELYVRDAVENQVPRPEPHIPPGHALTGMPAYLVTEHELSVGPIEIDMDLGFTTVQGTIWGEAVTTVDWGDGTQTEHQVPGAPHPDGQVHHTYTDKGEVDVQVTDRWDVRYEAADGAIAGTLVEALEPVTIDAFEVREYRAVRLNTEQAS